jgi:hypothetical protein
MSREPKIKKVVRYFGGVAGVLLATLMISALIGAVIAVSGAVVHLALRFVL